MDAYRQDLFDVFEGTTLDTYIPTPEESYQMAMEGVKSKIDAVYSKSTGKTDEAQEKISQTIDKTARKIAKSPEERAKEQGKQFPDNTDYMKYSDEVTKIKNILTSVKGVLWTVGIVLPPGTIPAILLAAVKIAIIDNAPLMSDFLHGSLSIEEINNRGTEIIGEISKIHRELATVITKLGQISSPLTTQLSKGLVAISKALELSINKFKGAITAGSAAGLVSALKAMAKKYCATAKTVEKQDKAVKESTDEEITESVFDQEEMNIITQLKFAAFENAKDYNPYILLDEFVEKCNYENDHDFDLLMNAFEFVYSL